MDDKEIRLKVLDQIMELLDGIDSEDFRERMPKDPTKDPMVEVTEVKSEAMPIDEIGSKIEGAIEDDLEDEDDDDEVPASFKDMIMKRAMAMQKR